MQETGSGLKDLTIAVLLVFLTACLPGVSLVHAQDRVVEAGEPIRLSSPNAAYSMQPRFSPTGDVVAFTGSNYTGLSVTTVSGHRVTELTDLASAGFGFTWSRDGMAVLSRVSRQEGIRTVHAVLLFDVQTNEARALTDYRSRMNFLPGWSDDDVHVILPAMESVEVLDTDREVQAGKESVLTPFFFASGDWISSVEVRSHKIERVSTGKIGTILNLVRSPDASRVAYEVMGGDLIVMNVDGSDRKSFGQGHRPRWSPDGKWIVYMVTEDDGYQFTSADLIAAKADGSRRVRLTNSSDALEMNPDWSPDDKFIAYDDRGVLFLLPIKWE